MSAVTFQEIFDNEPVGRWAAPGRVNLIGEHTDYNDGFCLPLALEQRAVVTVGRASGGRTRVAAGARPGEIVDFDASTVSPGEVTGWAAYLAGMFWALREAGVDVPQLEVLLDSDVPIGAGLSSSAAIECAMGSAILELADGHLDRTALALQGQRAENVFVGANTGCLDQMASMHGKDGSLVLLDMRALTAEPVPFDLAAHGLELLVIDTLAPHTLVDGQYAERRASCEEGARILGVKALRDVEPADLDDALARIDDERVRRRVKHVVTEDARVLEVVQTLRSGADPRQIGPALTASHVSMRDDFENSVPHVDIAVEAALSGGAHGARMTGGGFGGSVIALVDADRRDEVIGSVERAYAEHSFDAPRVFTARPSAGAGRLD